MQVKGIKHGQTIELPEQLDNIEDGQEVIVSIQQMTPSSPTPKPILSDQERLERLNQLFGVWKDQPDLIEIFAEIDRERHTYRGREIASLLIYKK